ncbi:hypothetical protein ACFLXE_04365 [Chloroflexota bacterium]
MAIEVILVKERETKNTVRYREEQCEVDGVDAELAVGTLYVQKAVLGSSPPEKLKVTIEEA